MFDINFIENPGIQNRQKSKDLLVDFCDRKEEKILTDNHDLIENKKSSNIIGWIISFVLILFVVFSYKVFDYNSKNELKDFSINYILRIINQFDENQVQSIDADSNEIRFVIKSNQNLFYSLLNLFKEINFNVKGSVSDNVYNVYINEKWYINNNSNLLKIRDCMKDFKGIESELLFNKNDSIPEKLIVVSDFSNLISLLEILEKRNLMHSNSFSINNSNNNTNYYEIIFHKYD